MLFLIWADEKYNTQKNPCVVFATQKNPGVFHRPKKIPSGKKCQPQKNPSDPPIIKICEWGPWGPPLQEKPPVNLQIQGGRLWMVWLHYWCPYFVFVIFLVQTPLHLACLSGDLTTVEHIVDMVGTEYLLQLHGPQIKPVRVVLRHPFFY